MSRRRRADGRRKDGQPFSDGRRIVIDDVVNARRTPLNGCHRRRGSIGDMNKRPYSRAISNHRKPAPSQVLNMGATTSEGSARTIKCAISQHYALNARVAAHYRLEMLDGPQRPPKLWRGGGLKGALFRFNLRPIPGVGPPSEALSDDPPNAHLMRYCDDVVRSFSAQPVRFLEVSIEMPQVQPRRDRRQLVHQELRARITNHFDQSFPI
jgi:hypothetical protein